jgi:hypothetical protein
VILDSNLEVGVSHELKFFALMNLTEVFKDQETFLFDIKSGPESIRIILRQSDSEFIKSCLEIRFVQPSFVFCVKNSESLSDIL